MKNLVPYSILFKGRVFNRNPIIKTFSKIKVISKMANIVSCHNPEAALLASELIKSGKVIAVPTDTVYGLACDGNNPEAIQKLYDIKGRSALKPVAICVNDIKEVQIWGETNDFPKTLLRQLLPGPVTLVFEKSKYLDNPYLNPETSKIGIRIPDHEFIKQITSHMSTPMALTSANISNARSTLSIKEFSSLFYELGGVFDGGTLNEGSDQNRAGSTVVDLSVKGFYSIIRKGVACQNTVKLLEDYGLANLRLF